MTVSYTPQMLARLEMVGQQLGRKRRINTRGSMNEEKQQNTRVTIEELERILDGRDDVEIEILPNGEVRSKPKPETQKPVTLKNNLGGEYAFRP
jgi:hypothetical protein